MTVATHQPRARAVTTAPLPLRAAGHHGPLTAIALFLAASVAAARGARRIVR
jgi:hypothetical protein